MAQVYQLVPLVFGQKLGKSRIGNVLTEDIFGNLVACHIHVSIALRQPSIDVAEVSIDVAQLSFYFREESTDVAHGSI